MLLRILKAASSTGEDVPRTLCLMSPRLHASEAEEQDSEPVESELGRSAQSGAGRKSSHLRPGLAAKVQ
eukprot:575859-Rhodomonas_salina.1